MLMGILDRAHLDAARLLEGAYDKGVGVLRVPVVVVVGLQERRVLAVNGGSLCTHDITLIKHQ